MDYKIDFSFFPSIKNIRRFASLGRHVVETFWPNDKKLAFEIELCLVEALSNVLFHAQNGKMNPKISFQIKSKNEKLSIKVYDQGKGFSLSDYLSNETNLYKYSGRGLHIINGLMDKIEYVHGKHQNRLILEKTIEPEASKRAL